MRILKKNIQPGESASVMSVLQPPQQQSISIPRSQTVTARIVNGKLTAIDNKIEDNKLEDNQIDNVKVQDNKIEEGTLKKVFLDKLDRKEFLIQIIYGEGENKRRRVLVLNDSRDSTSNYTIADTNSSSFLALVKKEIFPVIRVKEWDIGDQRTINIAKFDIVDRVKTVIGNPKPIQKSFYNYLTNLAKKCGQTSERLSHVTSVNKNIYKPGKIRCNVCNGCRQKSCRPGWFYGIMCEACKNGEKNICLRRKCEQWAGQVGGETVAEAVKTERTEYLEDNRLREKENFSDKILNALKSPKREAVGTAERALQKQVGATRHQEKKKETEKEGEKIDINLLPVQHPVRVRCGGCTGCLALPCTTSAQCRQCRAGAPVRCLARVCQDWLRYTVTAAALKELEQQQDRLRQMLQAGAGTCLTTPAPRQQEAPTAETAETDHNIKREAAGDDSEATLFIAC